MVLLIYLKPYILNEIISLLNTFTQKGRKEIDSAIIQNSVSSNNNNYIKYRYEEAEFTQVIKEEDILQISQPEQQEPAEPAEPAEPEQPIDQGIRSRTRVAHSRRVNTVVASSSSSASRKMKRKHQNNKKTTQISNIKKKLYLKTPKKKTA